MPRSCKVCGSSNVVHDDLYSQTHWVCEDCGCVIEEGHLTTTQSEETKSRAVPYYATTEAIKKPCKNLIAGLSRVHALCRILRLSSRMESEAVSLFERAYNHPNFIHVHLEKKEVLGGCCVLFICRQNDWPVAVGTICYLIGVDTSVFGAVYKELTSSLNIEARAKGITDLLESFCHEFKLGPTQVDEVLTETPQRLVERTSALLEIATEAWIVTGRQPQPLLMAAVYLAWQSLKPMARMKYAFGVFCQIGKLPEHSWRRRKETVLKRVNELRDVLCKLGRELPWLRGEKVEPNTVVTLVDDILKNRCALLLRAIRNFEQEQKNELSETQITETAQEPQPKDLNQVTDPPKELTSKENSELPTTHLGKRHLFLPPCLKNRKRQKVDEPQPEVTGDEEISDSEIDSYIRSQDEIKLYLKAQNELKDA